MGIYFFKVEKIILSGSTNGLVKVSLTVGGDAAGISQKSVSVTGDINWLGLSYQYNAVP